MASMNFDLLLSRYATLIVDIGANVQPGQLVYISGEAYHRDLLFALTQAAYKRGARYVGMDLIEPRMLRERVLHSSIEQLKYVPPFLQMKYQEFVEQKAAVIHILGPEYPELLTDLDAQKMNANRIAQYESMKYFYEKGISESEVQWTLAAASTPQWAQRVFPSLSQEEAHIRLWNEIFRICRVDQEDFQDRWKQLNRSLQTRAQRLTNLHAHSLHFTGPKTNLTVGLSEHAVFRGGSELSKDGIEFQPNLPTEECFTTPDYRVTTGRVAATRPFLINGKLIRDLVVEFLEGQIIAFDASSGKDAFAEYIGSDPGAKRLGEVALVGIDSPIYQSGVIFEEILFDENAACHIAIGSAYKFCIEGGLSMDEKALDQIGYNESSVHTDIMISNEQVHVDALLANGEKVRVIENGAWKNW